MEFRNRAAAATAVAVSSCITDEMVRAGIGRHGRTMFLPRRIDDAATASSGASDCYFGSRSVLRGRRRVCRELLE
jgi:hypothetical protein